MKELNENTGTWYQPSTKWQQCTAQVPKKIFLNSELRALLGHAIIQVVSRYLFIAETWVNNQGSQCEIFGGQNDTEKDFCQSILIFSVNLIPPNASF